MFKRLVRMQSVSFIISYHAGLYYAPLKFNMLHLRISPSMKPIIFRFHINLLGPEVTNKNFFMVGPKSPVVSVG